MTIAPPSARWTKEQTVYWNAHVALITLLGRIGPKLGATNRLNLFWFRNRLGAVYDDAEPELIETAVVLIDQLVTLRTRGFEPPSKNGKYV